MEKVATLTKDYMRMTVKKFEEGYLATIDHLDEDGDVEFGCSGEFCDTAQGAAWDTLDYYNTLYNEMPCSDFALLVQTLKD